MKTTLRMPGRPLQMMEHLELRVLLSTVLQSSYGAAIVLPATIQAENFDRGGEGVGYHDLTAANLGKAYRPRDGVDIFAITPGGADYAVSWTQAGEWMEYTVKSPQTAYYQLAFQVSAASSGGKVQLNVDGKRATGQLGVPNTLNRNVWTQVSGGTVLLTKGTHVLQLVMSVAGKNGQVGNFDWFSMALATPAASSDLVAVAQSSSAISLNWKNNSSYASGLIIQRSDQPAGVWQNLVSVASGTTSYVDRKLTAGQQAFYRVVASNAGVNATASNVTTETADFSGPIVISRGGTYSGHWESVNPNVPAVLITTSDPVVIENSVIRSWGDLIQVSAAVAHVTVRNNFGYGITPFLANRHAGRFLEVDGFASVTVENNYLQGTAGILLTDYEGDHSASQTVKVIGNVVRNIDGRIRDGAGGFTNDLNPDDYAQFVQIANSVDLRNAEIAWNEVVNNPWESQVEDVVSIYATTATADSPLLIHDNYIQGGYSANPGADGEFSGGGIMLSDNGSAWVRAYDNQVLETTNYGIAITSGHDNLFYDNRIISSGLLPDGTQVAAQNVGALIWNANAETTFTNNSGYGNYIGWMQGYDRNDTWTPDATAWTDAPGWPDGVEINLDATTAEWALWQQKVAANSVTLGADRTGVSAPIIITHGGTYQGNWQSLDAEIPAVEIRTSEPVIIDNSLVTSRGTLINIYNYAANVVVQHTAGYGLNPDGAGQYVGRFMDVDGWVSIMAQNNYLQSTAGIYLADYTGDGSADQTVKILRNEALNIDGRASNGKGGWAVGSPDPDVYRQFFQINGATLAGGEVAWNQVINQPGHSRVEENINIFATNGTPESPFLIHDNYIQGAFPADAIDARDYTGGGIMVSDVGSSFIQAFDNQIVSTGGIGMSISSGHDNSVFSNRVISSGLSPTGAMLLYSNTGITIWNANLESTFTNNSGHDNYVAWVSRGQRNDWWVPDASGWMDNVSAPEPITRDTERAEWTLWLTKLAGAAVNLGLVS